MYILARVYTKSGVRPFRDFIFHAYSSIFCHISPSVAHSTLGDSPHSLGTTGSDLIATVNYHSSFLSSRPQRARAFRICFTVYACLTFISVALSPRTSQPQAIRFNSPLRIQFIQVPANIPQPMLPARS